MISISFFVLLLTTYCYSVPVDPLLPTTTPDILPTTGKTIIEHESKINTRLVSDEELTSIPDIRKQRPLMGVESTTIVLPEHKVRGTQSSEERLFSSTTIEPTSEHKVRGTQPSVERLFSSTTIEPTSEHKVRGTQSSEERLFSSTTIEPTSEHKIRGTQSSEERLFSSTTIEPTSEHKIRGTQSSEERLFSSTTIQPTSEHHSSEETDIHKNLNKFHTTTMETKTHFEKKAIKSMGMKSSEEDLFSSTTIEPIRQQRSSEEKDIRKNVDKFDTTTTEPTRAVRENSLEATADDSRSLPLTTPMNMVVDKSRENSNERPVSSEKLGTTLGSKIMNVDRSRENSNEQHISSEKFGTVTGLLGNKPKINSESLEKHQQIITKNPATKGTETLFPVKIVETLFTVEEQPIFKAT